MRSSAAPAVALAAAVALTGLTGCTATGPVAMPTPTPTVSATPIPPSGDGVLRIGTLFASSADVRSTAPGQVAAAEIAARDIAAAAGVLGAPIELVHRDAGDAAGERLEAAFAELVARGADVVIGPSSSELVARLLPLAAEAGVALISPGSTDSTLAVADTGDVLFRTVPPLAAQVAAVGVALASDGVGSVALVTSDDDSGALAAERLRAVLDGTRVEVVATERLGAGVRPARLAADLLELEPEAVILATGADADAATGALLTALLGAGLDADAVWLTGQSLADYTATVPAGALEGAHGVREGVDASDELRALLRQSDPGLEVFRFAPETYDAVVLAALAAEIAGDDGGPSIAGSLRAAGSGGVACRSYGECLDVLANDREPDYEGIAGSLTLDEAGDPVDAPFALFRYSTDNRPERDGLLGGE